MAEPISRSEQVARADPYLGREQLEAGEDAGNRARAVRRGRLCVEDAPRSTATQSVNVPPMSTPR
jgi:hypothetical protein